MNDKRIHILRDLEIKKAVNKLAAPAIIGMLVIAIYNFADTIFVSWTNPIAPSATQVIMPLMLVTSAIGLALGIGGASYISRLLGMQDNKKAEKVVMTMIFLGTIFGVLTTAFNYIFMDEIFRFFGANNSIMNLTKDYGKYIIAGYTFLILSMILNNSLRSEGSAKYSMIGMLSGAVLNIVLDPIFIFVFHWGISGAAIATSFSNFVSFIILIRFYLKKKTVINLSLKNLSMDTEIYKEIAKVGTPTLLKQLLFSYSMKLLNTSAITYGGEEFLATMGVAIKIIVIPQYVIFGFGQGFQPVAGFNYGADKPKRVHDSFKYTIKVTSIIMASSALFYVIFGSLILKLFQANSMMNTYGTKILIYWSIGMLFLGATNTITVFFQALGKGFKSLLMSISRQGLFFIPIILVLPKYLGINGIIYSQPLSDILSVLLGLILVLPYLKIQGIEKLFVKNHTKRDNYE